MDAQIGADHPIKGEDRLNKYNELVKLVRKANPLQSTQACQEIAVKEWNIIKASPDFGFTYEARIHELLTKPPNGSVFAFLAKKEEERRSNPQATTPSRAIQIEPDKASESIEVKVELIEVKVEIGDAVDEQIEASDEQIEDEQLDYMGESDLAPNYSQRITNRKTVKQDELNAELDVLEREVVVLEERYRLFKLNEVGRNTLNLKKAAVASIKKQIKRLESRRIASIRQREKAKQSGSSTR